MKLFMSGAESPKSFETLCEVKQKYILMSFLYLRKRKGNLEEYIDKAGYDIRFMIDSGAHSFLDQGSVEAVLKKDLVKYGTAQDAINRYIDDYVEWLYRNKQYIETAVELDIAPAEWTEGSGDKVGLELNTKWREEIFSPLQKELGIDIVFVNHGEGLDELMKYGKFVGTSSVHTVSGSYGKVFTTARKHDLKVHGFAVTGREIRKYPFTTVDSTSWTMGQRYGITYYLAGGSLLNIAKDQKHRRKRFKSKCLAQGIDYEKFIKDDPNEVARWNCLQWKLFADYIEKRWTKNEVKMEETKELPVEVQTEQVGIPQPPAPPEENLPEEPGEGELEVKKAVPVPAWQQAFSFLTCADCYLGDRCPSYNEESKCYFDVKINMEEAPEISSMLNNLVSIQYARVLRGKMVEESDGGVPDKVLSQEITLLVTLLQNIKTLVEPQQDSLVVKAKGDGVIQKLFGALKDK